MESTNNDATHGEVKSEPEVVLLLHTTWASTFIQTLHSMQRTNDQCDIVFTNEDGVPVNAHSVVLSAASSKLKSDLQDCGPQVLLKGVSSAAIGAMVDFIYLGHVEVTVGEVAAVQALAEHFQIAPLAEVCSKLSEEADASHEDEKNAQADAVTELTEQTEDGEETAVIKEEAEDEDVAAGTDAGLEMEDGEKEEGNKDSLEGVALASEVLVLEEESRNVTKGTKGKSKRLHTRRSASRTAKSKASTLSRTGPTRRATGTNVCQKCGRKFKFPEGLTRHSQSHKKDDPMRCYLCSQEFTDASIFKTHLKGHQITAGTFKCAICNLAVSRKSDLRLHVTKVHGLRNQYKCKLCAEFFETRNALVLHRQTHGGQKPFPCEFCGREFLWRSNLKDHLRTHTGERPFACTHCDKTFSHDTNRKVHQRTHHADGSHCEDKVCNEAGGSQKRKPPAFIYKCEVCSKEFNRKDSYTKHMHRHNGTHAFCCDYCGKGFMERECFQTHIKGHQGISSSFKCEVCHICVTTKKGLAKHMRTMHQRDKQYQCTECGVTFVHRSSFIAHNMMHAGQKPYQCEHCKRTFRCSSHLKGHLRIHTGEKPYGCSFCNQKFAHNNSRKAHERQHHPDQVTGPPPQKRAQTSSSNKAKAKAKATSEAAVPAPLTILQLAVSGDHQVQTEPQPQPQPQPVTVDNGMPTSGQWDTYCVSVHGEEVIEQAPVTRVQQATERQYTMQEAQQLVTGTGELPYTSYTMWTQGGGSADICTTRSET